MGEQGTCGQELETFFSDGRTGGDQLPIDHRDHPPVSPDHGIGQRTLQNGLLFFAQPGHVQKTSDEFGFADAALVLSIFTGSHVHPPKNPPGRNGPVVHLPDVRTVFSRCHDTGKDALHFSTNSLLFSVSAHSQDEYKSLYRSAFSVKTPFNSNVGSFEPMSLHCWELGSERKGVIVVLSFRGRWFCSSRRSRQRVS